MKSIAKLISCILLGGACSAYTGNLLAEPETQISPYQPRQQPEKGFEELKKDLERAFRDFSFFCQEIGDRICGAMYPNSYLETLSITGDALSVTFKSAKVFADGNTRPSDLDYAFRIQFNEFAEVLRDGACSNPVSSGFGSGIKFALPRRTNFVKFQTAASFRVACDAMYNMGLHYQEKDAQAETRFNELAAHYRTLKTKPAMTEPQRRLVVQANALTQERKFNEAIERYRQLVTDDPVVYPAAYYNMALLSAELKLFKRAIRHMNRYLLLMPEANDARAAQDKIYEWELKAERN